MQIQHVPEPSERDAAYHSAGEIAKLFVKNRRVPRRCIPSEARGSSIVSERTSLLPTPSGLPGSQLFVCVAADETVN